MDTAYMGSISCLTVGAAAIASWRNALAMALAFPGILFYGIAECLPSGKPPHSIIPEKGEQETWKK